jgi:hypothetical protein
MASAKRRRVATGIYEISVASTRSSSAGAAMQTAATDSGRIGSEGR